ncbi:hypothetical protein PYCC9005_005049 [Savitreella phatthalungensis]
MSSLGQFDLAAAQDQQVECTLVDGTFRRGSLYNADRSRTRGWLILLTGNSYKAGDALDTRTHDLVIVNGQAVKTIRVNPDQPQRPQQPQQQQRSSEPSQPSQAISASSALPVATVSYAAAGRRATQAAASVKSAVDGASSSSPSPWGTPSRTHTGSPMPQSARREATPSRITRQQSQQPPPGIPSGADQVPPRDTNATPPATSTPRGGSPVVSTTPNTSSMDTTASRLMEALSRHMKVRLLHGQSANAPPALLLDDSFRLESPYTPAELRPVPSSAPTAIPAAAKLQRVKRILDSERAVLANQLHESGTSQRRRKEPPARGG